MSDIIVFDAGEDESIFTEADGIDSEELVDMSNNEEFQVTIDQTLLTFVLSPLLGNSAVLDSNGLLYVNPAELASTNW